MKFTSRIALALCASSMFVAAGCAEPDVPESAGNDDPIADEAEPQAAPADQRGDHRRGKHFKGKHHHPSLVKAALETLELTDAQRSSIEKLASEAKPSKEGRAAQQALNKAIADAVRAGKIDKAALSGEIAAVEAQMKANHDARSKTLEALHGILTSEQRVALVDGMKKHERRWEGRGPDAPDDVDADEAAPRKRHDKRARKGRRGGKDRVFGMLRRLDLSDEQHDQLDKARESMATARPDEAAMKQRFADMKAKKEAFIKAFASNDFNASALQDGAMKDMMSKKLDHKIAALSAIVPVLDEAQRGQLADMLLKKGKMGRGRMDKRFKGRHGKRGMPGARAE